MRQLLPLLFLLFASTGYAQEYFQTITGKVTDKESGTPLSNTVITLLNSTEVKGAVSDEQGNFKLEQVPVGRQSFKIMRTGYKDITLTNIVVTSGKQISLNIEMEESLVELEQVKITQKRRESQNSMATVSARTFSIEETQRYAAAVEDPARMAQTFAGITSTDDLSNEIVIRGNSPRGMLWKLEGIEIPSPNHFSTGVGSSAGGISMLPSTMLTTSDFYTAAFPAEYGNALSGVFDLKLRSGNTDKREYAVQLGILGAQVSAEGPFKKGHDASYLFNYRYSSLAGLNAMGIQLTGDAATKYQDLSFNMQFPTKNAGRFSVFGIGGISSVEDLALKDSNVWRSRFDRFQNRQRFRMGTMAATHFISLPDEKTYIKSIVSVSNDLNGDFTDTLDNSYQAQTIEIQSVENRSLRLSSTVNHKASARSLFRFGAIYNILNYRLNGQDYNPFEKTLIPFLEDTGTSSLAQAFLQWKLKATDKFEFVLGVHSLYFLFNSRYTVEPRIGMKWHISDKVSINAGSGLHSRIESPSVYMAKITKPDGTTEQPNKNIDFTRSFHNVLGINWLISPNLQFNTEVYYQYLFNVPVANIPGTTYSILNSTGGFVVIPLVNEGKGRNYGIEFTLNKFFAKNYYVLITNSLFQSKYTSLDGIEHNTYYNANYATNLVGGKEWKVGKNGQNTIGLNGKIIWRGGNRYTLIDMEKSNAAGRAVYHESDPFSTRLPDYYRADIGFSYRVNREKYSLRASVDVQNMTNRQNIANYSYDPFIKIIRPMYHTGIIPFFNLKLEF